MNVFKLSWMDAWHWHCLALTILFHGLRFNIAQGANWYGICNKTDALVLYKQVVVCAYKYASNYVFYRYF